MKLEAKREQLEAQLREIQAAEARAAAFEATAASVVIASPQTPLMTAKLFLDRFCKTDEMQTLKFCEDAFWRWKGPCFEEQPSLSVENELYEFLADAKYTAVNRRTGEQTLEPYNPTAKKISDVMHALKASVYCQHSPLSGAKWLDSVSYRPDNFIVFRNGILDLDDWLAGNDYSLMPHTPTLINSNYLPFDFEVSDDKPIEWLLFLRSIWPNDDECIATLQEWMGYSLTKDNSHQKMLLIVGPPRSGKGTIAKVFSLLLGEKNVCGPVLASLEGPFGLQSWLNKTHAIISDARLSSKSDQSKIAERLLSISASDMLTIERKRIDAIEVSLPARITIMTNEIPHLRDMSGALVSRFIILTMRESFLGREDISLINKIKSELPQILSWSLRGLKRLIERGYFVQPQSSAEHYTAMLSMSSPMQAFVKEICELHELSTVAVKSLYSQWQGWCDAAGYEYTSNIHKFMRDVRSVAPKVKELDGLFRGIGVRI